MAGSTIEQREDRITVHDVVWSQESEGRVWAIRTAREDARRFGMAHYAFEFEGNWAVSAGLHSAADRGFIVAFAGGRTIEVLPLGAVEL